ncbi:hypothetical protein GR925_12650 [Streptomyces sp. HUCO-GS316]|uniref:class I SAM-dependent methyltransferase n=1 Tax=Streptomyces sp. HUCO-GS316 TaxID=2692198 RepID=UPI00136B6CFE|nr:class I SAM-dependent methyltransferase [Streptomyces sp. HUCO-GS316]MXM64272.1 hypothetical protein [Streptomyces sp. HUCO-GS316]
MSAQLVQEFMSSIWRHAQEPPEGSLTHAPDIHRTIAQSDHAEHVRELNGLIEQLDTLTPTQQRLFAAAVDEVQIRSKLWLIDQLFSRHDIGSATLVVLGAWYGILPLLFNWRLAQPPARMVCIDISADACELGRQVIGQLYPNIEYQVADAMDLDYASLARDPSSVLINTICEHLPEADTWWSRVPVGQLAVLQSNNYDRCPDHVNCVKDLDEMKAQIPLSEMLYEGVLRLPIFDRFMLIGYR